MKTLTVLLILQTYSLLFSQWTPDVRLTNNNAYSYTSYNNVRCIAVNQDVVHIVWYDYRDGNDEIYYKKSTDGGLNWSADMQLTDHPAQSWYPAIAVNGNIVHVVWFDLRDGNYEIYYKRSTNAGISWSSDIRLTSDQGISGRPSVAVSGQVVHVVWGDLTNGNREIYYKRSVDGGINWDANIRLTNSPGDSGTPSVAVADSYVHVVWYDNRDGNFEIYYKRSANDGTNWEADTRLTNSSGISQFSSISAFNSNVHVVWHDNRDGNNEIYYKRTTDSGTSWEPDIRLTNNSSQSDYPSVVASGTSVHTVWEDDRDGNKEIYYKFSSDEGINWGNDTRLTNSAGISNYSSISILDQALFLIWQDNRDGNYEIYYKNNPTGNPVGIKNTNSGIPEEFYLSQNFPNPFNPLTTISWHLPVRSYVSLIVYDLLGNEVARLVGGNNQPGYYQTNFDGTSLGSGVYIYRLTAGNYISAKKMLMIK